MYYWVIPLFETVKVSVETGESDYRLLRSLRKCKTISVHTSSDQSHLVARCGYARSFRLDRCPPASVCVSVHGLEVGWYVLIAFSAIEDAPR